MAPVVWNGTDDVVEVFKRLHKAVFDSTLELAGDESWESLANPQNESSQKTTSSGSSRPSGALPYASTKINFGKFKGMTIGEINAAQGDDGKSGRSWLEWLAANTDQDFLKKAVGGFLEASK